MESCSQNIQRTGHDVHNHWRMTCILQSDRIPFSAISSCDLAFYATYWRRHDLFRCSVLNVIRRSSPAPVMVAVKLQKLLGRGSCLSASKIHGAWSPPLYYFSTVVVALPPIGFAGFTDVVGWMRVEHWCSCGRSSRQQRSAFQSRRTVSAMIHPSEVVPGTP